MHEVLTKKRTTRKTKNAHNTNVKIGERGKLKCTRYERKKSDKKENYKCTSSLLKSLTTKKTIKAGYTNEKIGQQGKL